MTDPAQHCPICRRAVAPYPRYPRYLCPGCATRAVSEDGRPLTFFNLGMSGGYGACYTDTQEPYETHRCFVDGVECHADEARFGGIVIETADT